MSTDTETFCPRCRAGVESGEHHEKCVRSGHAEDGEAAQASSGDRAEQLRGILERAAAATEGPWESIDLDHEINGERMNGGKGWWWVWETAKRPYYGGVLEADRDYTISGQDGRVYHVAGGVGAVAADDGNGSHQEQADATFLAHARTDVPWLHSEVTRQDNIIEAVLRLHQPESRTEYNVPTFDEFDSPTRVVNGCSCGSSYYPCPTVQVIERSQS